MNTIANIPDKGNKKRIIIIGGGFAGLEITKKLNSRFYQIILLDKNTYYQFQPLLYQVATGGLEPSSISYPLRKAFHGKKDFHFRMCSAECAFPDTKTLRTSLGDITYDYLIIATGCDTNYFGNDTLRDNAYALKSVSESLLLRNRILLSLEEAVSEPDPEKQKEILTFAVVGGGATGVELAGALADMKRHVLPKDYPETDFSNMQIHLIDGSPRLLSGLSPESSEKAAEILTSRNVIIHHNALVESYNPPVVKMSDGNHLRTRNLFWVAGVRPNSLSGFNEEAYERGQLRVNQYNEISGHKDHFALGDTALLTDEQYPKGHPQVAQVALQMARRLASNLNLRAKGQSDKEQIFTYNNKGTMATIGRNAAVVDIAKMHFGGFLAWWMWLIIHIFFIIGMRNKIMIFINWIWNYFNYDLSLRLLIRPKHNRMYDTPRKNNTP